MVTRIGRLASCSLFLCVFAVLAGLESPVAGGPPIGDGLHDLVILDPSAHMRGLPAVNVEQADGGKIIDIPPKVHVHRYYYSGDKEIQGPIINGGPVVVVATHPKTGERMYIDAVLPAGAPQIAYSKNSITYIFPKQRVQVKFQHFPLNPNKAVVKHHHGKGWGRNLRNAHQHLKEHVKSGLANSPVYQSVERNW